MRIRIPNNDFNLSIRHVIIQQQNVRPFRMMSDSASGNKNRKTIKGTGLWIRINSIRIRIQKFSSIRIRIHTVIESGSNPDPDPIRIRIHNSTLEDFFFIFLPLDPGSGFPIRIRIHKVIESGSNQDTDPYPQP
jgi:hypothetical protein